MQKDFEIIFRDGIKKDAELVLHAIGADNLYNACMIESGQVRHLVDCLLLAEMSIEPNGFASEENSFAILHFEKRLLRCFPRCLSL